jgi:hypothetical protein
LIKVFASCGTTKSEGRLAANDKTISFSVFFQTNIILRGMVAVKARAYGQKKKPSLEGL